MIKELFFIKILHLAYSVIHRDPDGFDAEFVVVHNGRLKGHILEVLTGQSRDHCLFQCIMHKKCMTINYNTASTACQIMSDDYSEAAMDYSDSSWHNYATLPAPVRGREGNPGVSCKELKEGNSSLPNGYYWINLGQPTEVYCDMKTNGGGWLMFGSIVTTGKQNTDLLDYRKTSSDDITKLKNVQDGNFLLTNSAFKKLRTYTQFSQLRIYCTKAWHKRVFHIVTKLNDHGKKVVDYFSLMSDECPACENSFEKLNDDQSHLATDCSKWDEERGYWSGCKWLGQYGLLKSLYNHIVYSIGHIIRIEEKKFECDDDAEKNEDNGYNNNGEWKYYVR